MDDSSAQWVFQMASMTLRTLSSPLLKLTVFVLAAVLVLTPPVLAQAQSSATVSDAQVQLALKMLEQLAQKEMEKNAVVGMAIGVVHKDKLIYARGFGVREVGTNNKVDPDTVFQLASVSKPIGATVLARLVGEGAITWDSKISNLDPSFQMYDPWVTREITIRDFYAHRSGLPEHAGDLLEDMGYDRTQVLHRLRYQKPFSSFRSGYAYTNFGMTEAAIAAAKAIGKSWEDLSAERLYKPLGMNSTSSRYADFIAHPNHAPLHVLIDGKWIQKYKRDPDAQSPAGGVSSSINDMAKWMRLRLANGRLDGKQIVAEKPLTETQHPQMLTGFNPFNGLPGFYGLGINVGYDEHGRLHLGHSGAFDMGAATTFTMVPKEQLGIVVLTNSYPMGVAEGLSATFIEWALSNKQSQDWIAEYRKVFADPATTGLNKQFDYSKLPQAPTPALPKSAYLGTYSNDLYGDVSILENSGGLVLTEGPHNLSFPLKHYDHDTFTYETQGENAVGRSGLTFNIAPDGKAHGVTIESLNEFGQGVFRRGSPGQ
jgi:CubicO group peptidase (beta-lactamase class C family)